MKRLLLLPLLLLPSCGLYTQLNQAVERVDFATKEADKALEGVQAGLTAMGAQGEQIAQKVRELRTAIEEADKNQDGRITGMEEWYGLILQLLTLLGVGGYAVQTNAKRRENVQALYEQIDSLKDKVRATDAGA